MVSLLYMDIEELFQRKILSLSIANKIAIAVSGGPDSLALLMLIHQFSHTNSVEVIVLTVNHNLRKAAQVECKYVDEVARSLGLSCHILTWQNPQAKQSEARAARYKLLTDWCKDHQVSQLILGHHQDDQAETLLMRLARGSGLDGLCAMHETSYNNGIKILRPLLTFTKQQLIDYLLAKNVKWHDDPSNSNLKYDRTIFRNYINSTNNSERLTKRLSLSALHMQRTQQALIFYLKQEVERCVTVHQFGYVDIDREYLLSLPEEMSMRIIVSCLMIIGNKSYKPRYKNFINLFKEILNDKYKNTRTLHGCKVIKSDYNISIRREISCISNSQVQIYANQAVIWDGRFRCTSNISGIICKNNDGTEIMRSLPLLKSDKKCIYPYLGQLNSVFKLHFIFSELMLYSIKT